MSGNLAGFNAAAVPAMPSFDPIPPGDYLAMIINSEMKPTHAGGTMLVLTFEVADGEHAGRRIWTRLNIKHPTSEKAQAMAERELGAICHAVGVITPNDSAELHDRPLVITVVIKPASGAFAAGNETKGYKSAGGASAPTQGVFVPPAPSSAPPAWQQPAAAAVSATAPPPWTGR